VTLSVVLITYNEEANLPRTLASVKPLVDELGGEIIVVDSGSTDRTREIAETFGARVLVEEWKGFAAQKNSAIDKAQGDWVWSLDADEEVSRELRDELLKLLGSEDHPFVPLTRYMLMRRKNFFLGRWMRHGGFWPDWKMRLFRQGAARFEDRTVHEDLLRLQQGPLCRLEFPLIHHAYPTLEIYLEHMRRYAVLGAEMIAHKPRWWLWLNRWFNPPLTFFYNYIVRLGFLDGREGLLLHWHHARYVSWKYANALALQRKSS
jgi:glycosyltransferase involved in cell wall biosynthesis